MTQHPQGSWPHREILGTEIKRCRAVSTSPKPTSSRGQRLQRLSLSPVFTTVDKRKSKPDIPQWVLDELLYIYCHALSSTPRLLETIGPFLDKHPSLYVDQPSKRRLGRKIDDWSRSPQARTPPSDKQAPLAAAFVSDLKNCYWQHRGNDHMSDDDVSELDIESPPHTPEKLASTKKASKTKKTAAFRPDPATFTMDPPVNNPPPYGFSSSELGVDYETILKCNSIVAINPQDPATFPDGLIAWEDKDVKVDVKGTQILKDRVAVLIAMTSPEAATEVTEVKLERNGQGFVMTTCSQDHHFVSNFDEIKEEVAAKAGANVDDPDGARFADKLQTAQTTLVDLKHGEKAFRTIADSENLLPMSKIIILFPPGYTVNNEHFNDVKAGDVFSLTPKLVEADDDEFFDEATFIKFGTYEKYLKKRTTSCILLEMVKDGKGVRHTGMSKEDTEEARKKKLADERKKAKERKLAKKQAVPDTPRSSA